MDVVRRKIEEQAASLYFAEEVFINEVGGGVGILPDFQKRNFVLALSVVAYVLYRDGYGSPSKNSINDTLHAYIPARMDTVRINQKTLIMDGAHNGQKMKSLVQSYQKQYGSLKAAVLLSLKNGKEYEEVLDILKPITEKLILTTFSSTQDLPSHAIDPRLLETHAIKLGYDVVVVEDNREAYQSLMTQKQDILLITGSFYLISQVRSNENLQHAY
jgi:dihydrofolate synthase/folylpolyglutamate synthase